MNIGENQIFSTEYNGFQIEIFYSDVYYAYCVRKNDFEDITKGFYTAKEALIYAKRFVDGAR
ncbi:hypothetical protein NIES4106_61790 (plasmid) [Fischerella sp. NIES-4106]|nr:hypothetical protein NIES4106_61790 [Fischerella sp. NIES-4106]